MAPRETYEAIGALFGALADPTRASIVHTLLTNELCTHDLAIVLGLSDPTVSQHLRVLRDLRLVRARRQGRLVLYRLDDAHVARLVRIGLTHEAEGQQPRGE
jgi:DNA-binding transcriptional ArsR family regulator